MRTRQLLVLGLLSLARSLAAQDSISSGDDLALDSLLNTPISTAAKYSQSVRQVAGSVTIVTAEDIRRFGYRTVTDVLQSMAGVYTSNPRSYESVGIRGFGRPTDYNNRILLLIDGHSVFESMWGQAYLGDEQAINLASVERIELVRGPSSALYGTGAMFAVVNIITRQGTDVRGMEISGEAGSLERHGAGLVAGFRLGDRGSLLVSGLYEDAQGRQDLYYPEFDSPSTNNGIAHDLDGSSRRGARVSGTLGAFSLRAQYTYRHRADPTGSYATLFNSENRITDQSGFVELGYQAELTPAIGVGTRAYYDDLRYEGSYPYSDGEYLEQSVNRVAGIESSFRWDLGSRNRLTVGGELRRNLETRYFVPADPTFLYGRPFSVYSVYAQNEFQLLPTVTVLGGIRHDEHDISGGATTPRAALLFDPRPGTTLKLMYGHAFRSPTIYESEFKSSAVNGALDAESLNMLELIWIQVLSDHVMFTASAFDYNVTHLIDAVEDTSANQLAYVNRDRADAHGVELSLQARPSTRSRGYLNYTYQRAVDAAGGGLTNSPRHMLKAGAAVDLPWRVTPAGEVRYESSRLTLLGNRTDGFLLANLNLTAHPLAREGRTGFLHDIEVGFRVENLFNTRYSHPGGTEHVQSAIEQNGRTFIARLTTRF
jgi:outer membrane receptor for ferrienterochelin and colicins